MKGQRILKKELAMQQLEVYEKDMKMQELSLNTIQKYISDISQWLETTQDNIKKEDVIGYKNALYDKYAVSSANLKIISVNRYLKWLEFPEIAVKTKRIQPKNGIENIITREGYMKMLYYAKTHNKGKMYCIMKTIAQTGIRIGELKYVTVDAIQEGAAVVWNKGKFRTVYFIDSLCRELSDYCTKQGISSGIIFCGRERGKAITPGAVWKSLKYIARQAEVPEVMVYPHSFRHLFAKEYMRKVGDISELADLLGHSRLETTWIYTKTTSEEKKMRLEQLDL